MLKCEKSYILNIVEVFTKMGDILYIKILRLMTSFFMILSFVNLLKKKK